MLGSGARFSVVLWLKFIHDALHMYSGQHHVLQVNVLCNGLVVHTHCKLACNIIHVHTLHRGYVPDYVPCSHVISFKFIHCTGDMYLSTSRALM